MKAFKMIWKMTEKNVEMNTLLKGSGKLVMNGVRTMVSAVKEGAVYVSAQAIIKIKDLIDIL